MVYVYRVDPSEMPYTFCPFNPPDIHNCSTPKSLQLGYNFHFPYKSNTIQSHPKCDNS